MNIQSWMLLHWGKKMGDEDQSLLIWELLFSHKGLHINPSLNLVVRVFLS